jgi:Lon protease-like protein
VLPLFIFEQRYRNMLEEVLQSHRLFAIFNERDDDDGQEEQPETIGTVGIVRAAHKNPDGTSNLALQGVIRVRLLEIVQESPYRMIRVSPCPNPEEDEDPSERMELRKHILSILDEEPELTSGLPEEYVDFIKSLEKPAPFIDVAIQSICHCTAVKQRLLETLSLTDRYEIFEQFLLKEQNKLRLFQQLQGKTREDEIDLN